MTMSTYEPPDNKTNQFSFLVLSYCYYSFYFEVTLFFVETIVFVIKLIQVVPFKPIQSFQIIHVHTTMHGPVVSNHGNLRAMPAPVARGWSVPLDHRYMPN